MGEYNPLSPADQLIIGKLDRIIALLEEIANQTDRAITIIAPPTTSEIADKAIRALIERNAMIARQI